MAETETGTILPIEEITRRLGVRRMDAGDVAMIVDEIRACHRAGDLARSRELWKELSLSVREHLDDGALRMSALEVMAAIASVGVGLGAWVSAAVCDEEIAAAALEDETTPAWTVADAFRLLAFLEARIGVPGVCPPRLVIGPMRRHARDRAVQAAACAAFAAWQTPDDDEFVTLRALDAVASALRTFPDDEDLAYEAIVALAAVVTAAPSNFSGQVTPEVVDTVAAAMLRWPDNEYIQEPACSFLWSAALSSSANRLVVARNGGLTATLAVMRGHPASPRVQAKALGALSNMLKSAEAADAFMASGGIQHVDRVMAANIGDGGIQHYGATVMWVLSLNRAIRRDSLGPCIATLKRALSAHPAHTQVVIAGCAATWKIAEGLPRLIRLIGSDGAALVVSVARQHIEDASIEYCMNVIAMLAMAEETAPILWRENVVSFILEALVKRPNSPSLQDGALFALWTLFVVEPRFALEALSLGGFDIVAGISLPSNNSSLMFLCGTLWSMIAPVGAPGVPGPEIPRKCDEVVARIRRVQIGLSEEISRAIANLIACSRRIENPNVTAAACQGKCTRKELPKCTSSACQAASGRYCSRCSVPQELGVCISCDGIAALKPYCKACIEKYHSGHTLGSRVFVPGTCCASEPP